MILFVITYSQFALVILKCVYKVRMSPYIYIVLSNMRYYNTIIDVVGLDLSFQILITGIEVLCSKY